ncbi:hypothetical protein D4R75_10630 [bacterium]|nr:MAG: hypothetical protein D4R75_10630 [bacterium]
MSTFRKSGLFRNSKNVSFDKALQGYFACESCGTLYRIVGYKPAFWIYMGLLVALFIVYWMMLPRTIPLVGYTTALRILLVWFLAVLFGLTYLLDRNAKIEKVEDSAEKTRTTT